MMLLRDLQDQFPRANLIGDEPGCEDIVAKVGLIEHPGIGFDLPLDITWNGFPTARLETSRRHGRRSVRFPMRREQPRKSQNDVQASPDSRKVSQGC